VVVFVAVLPLKLLPLCSSFPLPRTLFSHVSNYLLVLCLCTVIVTRPHPPMPARPAVPALRRSASGRPPPPFIPHLSASLHLMGTPPYYLGVDLLSFFPY
jgi:hypothetical protein